MRGNSQIKGKGVKQKKSRVKRVAQKRERRKEKRKRRRKRKKPKLENRTLKRTLLLIVLEEHRNRHFSREPPSPIQPRPLTPGVPGDLSGRWKCMAHCPHGSGAGRIASPSLPNQLLPRPPSLQALCHQESFLRLSLSGRFSWDNL